MTMAYQSSSEAIERLAADIGDQIYMDIAKWHLYLRDAKLHGPLAEQFYPLMERDRLDQAAVTTVLSHISVTVGEQRQIPLIDLLPSRVQARLLQLLQDYQHDNF
jgi:hypothetical protein